MKILVSILQAILETIADIFEILTSGGKRRYYKRDYPSRDQSASATQLQQPPEQANIPVPIEMGLESDEIPKYKKSKSVLTFRERILLRAIRQATDREYTILMKVRMGDFIWLSNEPKDKKFHNNQILCKHVDFLLCGKFILEPLLVIELDDSSHNTPDRIARDKFKDDTFDSIGLPFLRIELQQKYDVDNLKRLIQEKMGNFSTPAPYDTGGENDPIV